MTRTAVIRKAPWVLHTDAHGELMRFDTIDAALIYATAHGDAVGYPGARASKTIDVWAPGWRDGPDAGEIGMEWLNEEVQYNGPIIELWEDFRYELATDEIDEGEEDMGPEGNGSLVRRVRVLPSKVV